MKTKLHFGVLLLLSLFWTNCSNFDQALPKNFDYGEVKDDVYSNAFFDFSMNIPSGWFVQNKEEMEEIREISKNIIAGDDKKMKTQLDASDITSAHLLTVFQYELYTPVMFNPNLIITVDNLKTALRIKTETDCLKQLRETLLQTQLYTYVDDEFDKETINEVDFYLVKAGIEFEDFDMFQKCYVTFRNGFAICFIISFIDEEQEDMLMISIKSIKFD
jgi:hypothetical protein